MRDVTRDPKYKSSNAIPFAFHEGDEVVKRSGDYTFEGVILACFRKRSGAPRYAVENDQGLIHILNHDQLEHAGKRMATDFAWVIEKGSGDGLRYYAPTEPGEWTADHLKACRFARKQDAEAIQFRHVEHCDLPVYGTRVAEHGWG